MYWGRGSLIGLPHRVRNDDLSHTAILKPVSPIFHSIWLHKIRNRKTVLLSMENEIVKIIL